MKLHQYSKIKCLAIALCISNAVAVARDNHDEATPDIAQSKNERSSRRLLRRGSNSEQRQLQGDDDDNVSLNMDFAEEEEQVQCKSVIAVAGTKLRRLTSAASNTTDDTRSLFGDFHYNPLNIEISYEEEDADDIETEFVCELEDGDIPIQGTGAQIAHMRNMLNKGNLVSGETSVEVGRIHHNNGFMSSGGGGSSNQGTVSLPPGSITIVNNDHDDDIQSRRKLAASADRYIGAKKVLIVRVTDSLGEVVKDNAAVLSDKFFGTNGDQVTVASGFDACSYGKLTWTHDYGPNAIGNANNNPFSAPGVVDVTINVALNASDQPTIIAAIRRAVNKKLGVSLPNTSDQDSKFDHVVMVVGNCYEIGTDCSFAAYAYINHWLSVFIGDNYKYPAVVMHEIGHNMNLAHSGGTDGGAYSDHTCLMGDPLWEDDVGAMCYNPVKNFQIAMHGHTNGPMSGGNSWYNKDNIKVWNSLRAGGTSWKGKLIGVADYGSNPSNHPIILKLETATNQDWFIGFNRATGINADNVKASDRVTIYKVRGGNGRVFSQSSLRGALHLTRTATINNWRKTGKDLVIKVNEINTDSTPGYADIEVLFGPQPTPSAVGQIVVTPPTSPPNSLKPTMAPTPKPTATPTEKPTSSPTSPPTSLPTQRTAMSPPSTSLLLSFENGIGTFDSSAHRSWSGNFISAEYFHVNPSNRPIIMMLLSDDGAQWFIGFNNQKVTITKMKDGGHFLKGSLFAGQSETIGNWRNSGLDLTVNVNEIDASVTPHYANIEILLKGETSVER